MDVAGLPYQTSDPAMAVNAQGVVVACNQGVLDLLGYQEAEVVGRPCWEVVRAHTRQGDSICSPMCVALDCFRCGTPFGASQVVCRRADGSEVQVSMGSLIFPDPQGDETGVTLILLRPLEGPCPAAGYSDRRYLWAYVLGPFRLYVDGAVAQPQRWRRRQAVVLLKYLLAQRRRRVHREELVDLLWPETSLDTGLQRLKVVVYFLRRQLEPKGRRTPRVLLTEGESYALDLDLVWVDSDAFDDLAEQGDRLWDQGKDQEALERYRQATLLYRGEFMADEPYSDWCFMERERMRERFIEVQLRQAKLYCRRSLYARAVESYRRALGADPCREVLHRGLMESLWRQGRRDEALRQYRLCRRVLAQEMGTEPSPETHRLYRRIAASQEPLPA